MVVFLREIPGKFQGNLGWWNSIPFGYRYMGIWYIYLHENHQKSTIHVGKYTVRSMDPMGLTSHYKDPLGNQSVYGMSSWKRVFEPSPGWAEVWRTMGAETWISETCRADQSRQYFHPFLDPNGGALVREMGPRLFPEKSWWNINYAIWPEYFMGPLQIVGDLDLYLVTGLPPPLKQRFFPPISIIRNP